MPHYFFRVHDDLDASDDEGAKLPCLAAAEHVATKSARALMCDTLTRVGRISLNHRIDIEDPSGTVLATVNFGDAVMVTR